MPIWIGTAIALFYALENWRGRRIWNAYVAEVNARGDSLEPAAVTPPSVPDAENFALAPPFLELYGISQRYWEQTTLGQRLRKLSWVGRPQRPVGLGWKIGRFIDLAAWQTYFRNSPDWSLPSETQSPEKDVLTVLSFYDKEVAELRAANARPHARFPLPYGRSGQPELKHLAIIRDLIQPIQLRCSAHLAAGDTETAFQELLICTRLSEAIKDEPFLASVLFRGSLVHVWMQQFWEGLVRHQWSEPQLVTFEERLASIDLADQFRRSIRGERNVTFLSPLEAYRQDPATMWKELGHNLKLGQKLSDWLFRGEQWKDKFGETAFSLIPTGWFDQNKVSVGRALDRLQESVDPEAKRFFPERSNVFEEELIKIGGRGFSPYTAYGRNFKFTEPSIYYGVLAQLAEAQGFVNLVRIAIALERHRLRHGEYPETLATLDGDVLPNGGIPPDPASGTNPHYKKLSSSSFTLYYDGWNGIDNGGITAWKGWAKPVYPDRLKGDWVWPQPSK